MNDDELRQYWEQILKSEGLGDIDRVVHTRGFNDNTTQTNIVVYNKGHTGTDVFQHRREWLNDHEWRNEINKRCWDLYSHGVSIRRISEMVGISKNAAKFRLVRLEAKRLSERRTIKDQPVNERSTALDILEIFAESAMVRRNKTEGRYNTDHEKQERE